jgi:phosphate/sulfate permease
MKLLSSFGILLHIFLGILFFMIGFYYFKRKKKEEGIVGMFFGIGYLISHLIVSFLIGFNRVSIFIFEVNSIAVGIGVLTGILGLIIYKRSEKEVAKILEMRFKQEEYKTPLGFILLFSGAGMLIGMIISLMLLGSEYMPLSLLLLCIISLFIGIWVLKSKKK